MGGLFSFIFGRREPPKTPIKGFPHRIQNLFRVHYRGLIGMIVPLAALTWHNHNKEDKSHITLCMWLWMAWTFLIQPVSIPVAGLIPIFILPMTGVVKTDTVCPAYMREGTMMFILSSMVVLLLNNSGCDRRIALWFLSSGDTGQYSPKRLVFKASIAGFILSLLSSRLIVSAMILEYTTKVFGDFEVSTKGAKNQPDFKKIRYIINSAISTSCTIGSLGFLHSSYGMLTFRLLFHESAQKGLVWPDIFNYLEYSAFAIPVCVVMLIVNILYHILLIGNNKMTVVQMNSVKATFQDHKKKLPARVTLHEKMTVFALILILLIYFFRWNKYFNGWSYYRRYNADIPQIDDATVSAVFVFLLHALPNSFKFLKKFTAKKKSQIMPNKTESGILWWRFVDKNVNYGYIYLLGSGVALMIAIRDTGLNHHISRGQIGKIFTEQSWPITLLLVVVVSIILGNIMSPCAACVSLFPLIVNMFMQEGGEAAVDTPAERILRTAGTTLTSNQVHIAGLACGMACTLSFMFPFLYTPSYFCYNVGKVPKKNMAPYGVGCMVLCGLILWVAVTFYAPCLYGTVEQVAAPVTGKPTTGAEAEPAGVFI